MKIKLCRVAWMGLNLCDCHGFQLKATPAQTYPNYTVYVIVEICFPQKAVVKVHSLLKQCLHNLQLTQFQQTFWLMSAKVW